MPRNYERFTERFRALVAHETRQETGKRIGASAPYVSALAVGRHGPSPRLLERIVAAYRLERGEWYDLAGHGPAGAVPPVLPHGGARPPAAAGQYPRGFFRDVIEVLSAVYGEDLDLRPDDLPAPEETKQQVTARLVAIAERAQARRDRRKGHKAGSKRPPGAKGGAGVAIPN